MLATVFSIFLLFQAFLNTVECKFFSHFSESKSILSASDTEYYRGTIFNRLSTEPKNYTIAYKYEADILRGMPKYVEVNVHGVENSTATIKHDLDSRRESAEVTVWLKVTNAVDLKSSIQMVGLNTLGDLFQNDNFLLASGRVRTTKRLVLCENRPIAIMQPNAKIGGMRKFGKRRPGDTLLRLEKLLVKPETNRNFPRHTFHFFDNNARISEVIIAAGTRNITFNNKIWRNEYQFQATLYGLVKDQAFWAQFNVYGTKLRVKY